MQSSATNLIKRVKRNNWRQQKGMNIHRSIELVGRKDLVGIKLRSAYLTWSSTTLNSIRNEAQLNIRWWKVLGAYQLDNTSLQPVLLHGLAIWQNTYHNNILDNNYISTLIKHEKVFLCYLWTWRPSIAIRIIMQSKTNAHRKCTQNQVAYINNGSIMKKSFKGVILQLNGVEVESY